MLNTSLNVARQGEVAPLIRFYEDPLDEDSADDQPITITARGLVRIAMIAAEAAARFTREQSETDAVTWMLTPRRMFDGRRAIEACLGRDECLRGLLLHGLSIGLDADPEALDALAADDDESDEVTVAARVEEAPTPRLWTAYLVDQDGRSSIQAFDAVIAGDRVEAETLLRVRHGASYAGALDLLEGFDASLPLSEALVSPALTDLLEQVARDPASPLAEGLSISVQQRFSA